MKTCLSCKQEYPLDNFYNDISRSDGKNPYCKPCRQIQSKSYNRSYYSNPDVKKKRRAYKLNKLYGISNEVYNLMYKQQDGKCKICETNTKLMVDHDHETGRVRGLLCSPCNRSIGQFKESPEILRKAALYVETNGSF